MIDDLGDSTCAFENVLKAEVDIIPSASVSCWCLMSIWIKTDKELQNRLKNKKHYYLRSIILGAVEENGDHNVVRHVNPDFLERTGRLRVVVLIDMNIRCVDFRHVEPRPSLFTVVAKKLNNHPQCLAQRCALRFFGPDGFRSP